MRGRGGVRVLRLDAPWEENWRLIRQTRFSRYPLVAGDGARPLGTVHVKDLVLRGGDGPLTGDRLRELARPCREVSEELPLEEALAGFQRRNDQMAVVCNAQGIWTGILTIEDVLEEVVGKISDEFDQDRASQFISLADGLSPRRVVLDLRAGSMREAIENLIARIPREELPVDPETVTRAVLRREEVMPTYLGHGLAVPHARLERLDQPVLAFARSDEGVPAGTGGERADLLFLLLTPAGMARVQPRLLAEIAGLFESEYVAERLRKAQTPEAVIEAIRAGQEVAID
jgi:mannitol/fructose-specific phosphotransferase system IIA component (Ntr-type)